MTTNRCPCCGRHANACSVCREMPGAVRKGDPPWPWRKGHGPDVSACLDIVEQVDRQHRVRALGFAS